MASKGVGVLCIVLALAFSLGSAFSGSDPIGVHGSDRLNGFGEVKHDVPSGPNPIGNPAPNAPPARKLGRAKQHELNGFGEVKHEVPSGPNPIEENPGPGGPPGFGGIKRDVPAVPNPIGNPGQHGPWGV